MKEAHVFRFFGNKKENSNWELSEADNHQALHVVRLNEGDVFEICDFKGRVAICKLIARQKQHLSFEVLEEKVSFQPSDTSFADLVLAQSKPGYFLDVLPTLNELGFRKVALYFQKVFPSKQKDSFKEKINRILLESSKQCKRDFLMEVEIFESAKNCLEDSNFVSREAWVLMPNSDNLVSVMKHSVNQAQGFVIIGSEQGFDSEELEYFKSRPGLRFTKLGSLVLRSFTASVVAASLLFLDKAEKLKE